MTKHIAWVAVTVAVLGCAHAGIIAQEVPLERLTLPQGFRIDVYASGVENARQMTLSPSGTLFVGTRQAGNVYAVVDDNDDQRADRVLTELLSRWAELAARTRGERRVLDVTGMAERTSQRFAEISEGSLRPFFRRPLPGEVAERLKAAVG